MALDETTPAEAAGIKVKGEKSKLLYQRIVSLPM
jgi:hypothetical protein